MREFGVRSPQCLFGEIRADRRGDIGTDAAIAEKLAICVKERLAAGPNVYRRSRPVYGGIPEIAKWKVCVERRPMLPPFLGFRFDIGCNVPPRQTNQARGQDAGRIGVLRQVSDLMIRAGLPQPVGGCFGIVAKALLALTQRNNGLFQLFPCRVLRGDIHVRTDEFADLAVAIEDRMRHGMYALDGSIRENDPKVEFDFSALPPRRLPHHPAELLQVFRGDTSLDGLRRGDLIRIKSKQAKDFGRPIDEVAAAHAPGPTARMGRSLSFSQRGFAATQLLLRFLGDRDIGYCADKLEATERIYRSPCTRMEILYRSVRHQQSLFILEI